MRYLTNPYSPDNKIVKIASPKKYEPNAINPPTLMRLPSALRPYSTPNQVTEALLCGNRTPIKDAWVYMGMKDELQKNENGMLEIIKAHPEAYLYVDKILANNQEFRAKALVTNPRVYEFLTDDQQQDKKMVDAYARGVRENGCRVERFDRGYVFDEVHVFKDSLSEKCDPKMFYSLENYQQAYESILNGSPILMREHTACNIKDSSHYIMYSSDVTFVYMAREANPSMKSEYDLAEANAIYNNLDSVSKIISKNPECELSQLLINKVNEAWGTFENPRFTLRNIGVEPQPEKAQALKDTVKQATHEYWLDVGKDLRNMCERYMNDQELTIEEKKKMDGLIEQSDIHPELKVVSVQDYWAKRGDEMRSLQEKLEHYGLSNDERDGLRHLIDVRERHSEMQDNSQMYQRWLEQEVMKIEKEQEQEHKAIIQGLVDQAYSEASIGEIDIGTATNIAGYAGAMHATTSSSVAQEQVASIRDIADDIENGGMELEGQEEYDYGRSF